MPFNKEALIRYRTIDACLRKRNKKYYTLRDIQEAIEDVLGKTFSISMLQKDLYAMRYDEALGYNAPIAYHHAEHGYYYTDADFTISNLPLNENELQSLQMVAQTLKQYSGRGIFKHFDEAIDKIKQAVSFSAFVDDDSTLIQFEQSSVAKGIDWVQSLYEAARDKYVVKIQYRKILSDSTGEYELEPYLLKEYQHRWYVIGREVHKKQIQTFGLDRIEQVKVTRTHFIPDAAFNPDAYFKYSIGISAYAQNKPIEVVLRFGLKEAHYILTKPLHSSQEVVKETAKYVDIKLVVYDSYELVSTILGFGEEVEVLQPTQLRQKIKALVKRMEQKYQ